MNIDGAEKRTVSNAGRPAESTGTAVTWYPVSSRIVSDAWARSAGVTVSVQVTENQAYSDTMDWYSEIQALLSNVSLDAV